MTHDRERRGDWDRTQWSGSVTGGAGEAGGSLDADERLDTNEERGPAEAAEVMEGHEARWVKTQWAGDQGEGLPAPVDPDRMAEGDTSISGERHTPGGQQWAAGHGAREAGPRGDRPLEEDPR